MKMCGACMRITTFPLAALFALPAIGLIAGPVLGKATSKPAKEPVVEKSVGKDDGYRGIWYFNQPTKDEYAYKYSGGLGTYCANHTPMAIYAPKVNKTFFCYGGTLKEKRRLLEMVSYYDHATGMVPRPTILMDKGTDDAHDNPVLSLDDAGYVWVFASSHGTGRPSYIFKSDQPYSTDLFHVVRKTNFSYPQVWHFKDKGFLFLHTLYRGGRFLFTSTSADGLTWSEPVEYSHIAQGHYQVSRPFKNKVGTSFMYHPEKGGLNFRTNLYYMETDDFGRTWRTAQGKSLQTPLKAIHNDAMVHDYEADGLLVYIMDLNYDAEGKPIVLYLTCKGWEPGPQNGPHIWVTARWTGSDWEIRPVTISDNNYDTGSLYVEDDGLWRIIGPTQPGPQAFNPGGEMACWTSTDRGKTWKL
jgi:hypothetical protein